MLTFSKQVWLAATLAALIALAAGISVAASRSSVQAPDPATAPFAQSQDDDDGAGAGCTDRGCGAWDETEEGGTGSGDDEGGGGGDGVCTWTGGSGYQTASLADQHISTIEIPCNHPAYGWWNASRGCYYGDFPPIRAIPDPPPGKTEEDGRHYYLLCPTSVRVFNGELVFQFNSNEQWTWVDNAEVPVATPLQVAEDWLANAPLDGLQFELAPPPTGSGLINLPVWLGVNEEDEFSWGPTGDSHCLGTVCVSIEAIVDTVEWSMGDGTAVTCNRDQHVGWQRGMDFLAPGDNCHHYYRQASRGQPDGKYQITATSHWAVHWESEVSDVEGDLETEQESTVALQIDEIQVLTTE